LQVFCKSGGVSKEKGSYPYGGREAVAQAEEHYTRERELRKQGYDLEKIAERVGRFMG